MKKDILLLHGALGSKQQFTLLKKELENGFQVHTMDFDGHGANTKNGQFTIPNFTKNVLDFLDNNGVSKTHIFGYSMGGYVALNLASTFPSCVEKIVTLGTKFHWAPEISEKEIKMLNPKKIEEKVPAFAAKLRAIHSESTWKTVVANTAQMMHRLGNGAKITTNELSKIRQNTLICVGDQDQMVSIEESAEAANAIPNGRLSVISDFVHPIEKIDPYTLAQVILGFL